MDFQSRHLTPTSKPRILVISHVLPFPGNAGQQQRVYYKLVALREKFHITFLTFANEKSVENIQKKLMDYVDEAIVLSSLYSSNLFAKTLYRFIGFFYRIYTSLKLSNFIIGDLEFSPRRITKAIKNKNFDIVLFEYWHSVNTVNVFRKLKIPSVLDMHNILWQSYNRQLDEIHWLPSWIKKRYVENYRRKEEKAWTIFDGLIAINKAEFEYAKSRVREEIKLFYVPMGINLELWPYSWAPIEPPRVAYYGGLGSPHNQKDAYSCYRDILPIIWQENPAVELWIVGSNPPDWISNISKEDSRVNVTGYIEQVQDILKTMTLVLCPWSGTYGFRSRLVEVMALGIPVISSREAVFGMDLENGEGIYLINSLQHMANTANALLKNFDLSGEQSKLARKQVEKLYSYQSTYIQLAKDLLIYASNY